MMKKTLLFSTLFSLLLIISCSTTKTEIPVETVQQKDSLKYLALGDSYTIGQSVNYEERYPSRIASRLQVDEFDFFDPVFVAKTGWTTDELDTGIQAAQLEGPYDLVSLLIGVNNQYRSYPIENYTTEFEALLKQAIEFAGGDKSRVFVISIPDYAFTPFGQATTNPARISEELDEYNAINKSITESYDIQYFNITPISRLGNAEPELVASDNLHPSGEQYKRWVDLMYEEVKSLLE